MVGPNNCIDKTLKRKSWKWNEYRVLKSPTYYREARRSHTCIEHMPRQGSFLLSKCRRKSWALVSGRACGPVQTGCEGKDRLDKHLAKCLRYAPQQRLTAFCQKSVAHTQWGSTSGRCHVPLIFTLILHCSDYYRFISFSSFSKVVLLLLLFGFFSFSFDFRISFILSNNLFFQRDCAESLV